MASEAVEISLPQSFFDALASVEGVISSGFEGIAEENPQFVSPKQVQNPVDNVITKIVPVFSGHEHLFEKIGTALFQGGAKVFFDYWKKVKKNEEYSRVQKPETKAKSPTINVNVPEKREVQLPPKFSSLLDTLAAMGLAGIVAFLFSNPLSTLAQFGEILLNSSKIFFSKNLFGKATQAAVKLIAKISKPFSKLGTWLKGFGKLGNIFGTGIAKLSGATTNFLSSLVKAGGSFFSKFLAKFKFIPFIGPLLGLYQAYKRYEEEDYVKGTLELASAVTALGGPAGAAISIGISAVQGVMSLNETEKGSGNAIKAGASALKVISTLPIKMAKFLAPLKFITKRIPILGTVLSIGMAINDFKDGKMISGVLNLASGIAALFPGIGTVISIGIDVVNYLINRNSEDNEPAKKNTEGTEQTVKDITKKETFWNVFKKYARKIMGKIPYYDSFLQMGKAIDQYKKGEIGKGSLNLLSSLASIVPFVGGWVSRGVDYVNNMIYGAGSAYSFDENDSPSSNGKTADDLNADLKKDVQAGWEESEKARYENEKKLLRKYANSIFDQYTSVHSKITDDLLIAMKVGGEDQESITTALSLNKEYMRLVLDEYYIASITDFKTLTRWKTGENLSPDIEKKLETFRNDISGLSMEQLDQILGTFRNKLPKDQQNKIENSDDWLKLNATSEMKKYDKNLAEGLQTVNTQFNTQRKEFTKLQNENIPFLKSINAGIERLTGVLINKEMTSKTVNNVNLGSGKNSAQGSNNFDPRDIYATI